MWVGAAAEQSPIPTRRMCGAAVHPSHRPNAAGAGETDQYPQPSL